MTDAAMTSRALLERGVNLERVTLVWNVVGIVVLAAAAIAARSVALAGFGLDSLLEIGASTVVLWELSGTGQPRQRRALRLIGAAFIALAAYIAVQSTVVLVSGYHPRRSLIGIGWTAITAAVMFILAAAKANTGRALNNPVLQTEARVTSWMDCSLPPCSSVSRSTPASVPGGPPIRPPVSSSCSTA